jgi:hypothetical protein
MKNFFTAALITTAALCTLDAVSALGAKAEHINGYEVIVVDSGSYSEADSITVWGPAGVESISVRCAPFDWQSRGANTVDFVDSIARSWCF